MYRTVAVRSLSGDTVEQLAMGEIDGVILLSPHTAAVYASLVRKHGLTRYVKGVTHFCLSQAVRRRLEPLGEVRHEVAGEPSMAEMLALISQRAENLAEGDET